jgi:hypothetical protein
LQNGKAQPTSPAEWLKRQNVPQRGRLQLM